MKKDDDDEIEVICELKGEPVVPKTNIRIKMESGINDEQMINPHANRLLEEESLTTNTTLAQSSADNSLEDQSIKSSTESFEPEMIVCDSFHNGQQYFCVKRKNSFQNDLSEYLLFQFTNNDIN